MGMRKCINIMYHINFSKNAYERDLIKVMDPIPEKCMCVYIM